MTIKKLKEQLSKNPDPIIIDLIEAFTGIRLKEINSKQRSVFMKKIRQCVGYETEEALTSGLSINMILDCVVQKLIDCLLRKEFNFGKNFSYSEAQKIKIKNILEKWNK